jgi:hypothetical protein
MNCTFIKKNTETSRVHHLLPFMTSYWQNIQMLLEAGHTMHISAAIKTGDQYYNHNYGMSCLKYDNVMALYRFYIAFNFTPIDFLQLTIP